VLYDSGETVLKTADGFWPAFISALPTCWWLAQRIPEFFYVGWNHDPAFFTIYIVPWTILGWVYEATGGWGGQLYAVASQDAFFGFAAAGITARLLARASVWRDNAQLRALAAAIGALLPWVSFVQTHDRPEYWAVATYSLTVAYGISVLAAFLAPVARAVRGVLLLLALAVGGSLTFWRLEAYEWLFFGSLVATFVLLFYSLKRLRENESVV